ncbi:hypothetical protein OS493_015966 [Desmophyllum pertusum]|uniref:Uncharacterized protein n=1 Tax=Desmophyllum pertusum TaxID=174260 RepID=A0A9W9YD01_9CNID|nr:hypothetical protein OS493_015966 [Desmophyllum pertusum]
MKSMDNVLLVLSLVLVVMATSTIGRTKKHHRHLLIKKFLAGGKRSGFPWWTSYKIKGLKKGGRRSPGASYPYADPYAAYAPSPSPAPPSFYPSAYPPPPSGPLQYSDSASSPYVSSSYSSPSSYPASPSYYPASSYPSPAPYPSPYPSPPSPFSSASTQAQQLSYSTSPSSPYTNDQYQQQTSNPSQLTPSEVESLSNSAAYLMVPGSAPKPISDAKKPRPKPTPPDRTEKFEIRGRCKHQDKIVCFLSLFF